MCGATVCASCLAALIGSETNLPSPFGAPTTENAASTAVVSRCKTCAQTLEWRHEDAQAFNAALDAGDTELLRQAFAQVCLFTAVPIPGGPRAPRDVLCAFGSEARFSPVHRSGRPNAPDAMCLVKAGVKANDPSFLRFACAEIKASVDALDATHVSPLMFALDVYRQHHTAAHPLLHQSLECLHVLVSAGANVSAVSLTCMRSRSFAAVPFLFTHFALNAIVYFCCRGSCTFSPRRYRGDTVDMARLLKVALWTAPCPSVRGMALVHRWS